MMKHSKLLICLLTAALVIPGGLSYAKFHFRGGDVYDPWRHAKIITDYEQKLQTVINTARQYANAWKQLTAMASGDKAKAKEALSSSAFPKNWEDFDPEKYILENHEVFVRTDGDGSAILTPIFKYNANHLEAYKYNLDDADQYLKAMKEINDIEAQGNLTEWQKANYDDALTIIRTSREIDQIARAFKGNVLKDYQKMYENAREESQNRALYGINYYDPYNEKKEDGTTVPVSTASPDLGLKKF